MRLTILLLAICIPATSAEVSYISDQQIASAIARGLSTDARKIWKEVRSKRRILVNRGGFDPVEKHITFVNDYDRISLVASDRLRRRMPDMTVVEAREIVPLGIIEARLEVIVGGLYRSNLAKWCAPMVHYGDRH
jgi:hypothetical protein